MSRIIWYWGIERALLNLRGNSPEGRIRVRG
jgi:hypothetical protein